jgi:hypothetical protein
MTTELIGEQIAGAIAQLFSQMPRSALMDILKRARVNVHVVLRGPEGEIKEERRTHNLITDVGCAHLADQLASVHDETEMSHMAVGTGNTAPAGGDTTLVTELDRNALTSRTQGAGGDDHKTIYVGDWAAGDGTGALEEAGILNAGVAGTLLARTVFSVINKGAADTLQITWTLAVADDGV